MDTNPPRAATDLPNPLPRPEAELAALEAVWESPRGWRRITEINNNFIGPLFVGTALLFFLLAGLLALVIRAQLAWPGLTLVDPATYNQLFTMHGTVMMFLFAVPAVEAVAIALLPAMLGARELPFPRLGAYAYLIYAIGGLSFYCSIFFGIAPDGGWFMYPPLTSKENSPGVNTDMYLLGIGFIEISAIAGAIELIVGILRCRAPGMTLGRMPIFAWAMLVFAAMVIFAFPAVIVASTLLELERAFDWPFFLPERGGDPLLWQHLFWFFGHPEVYVIFLPAAGMVSMIVPAMARTPLVAHSLVVLALVGTGFLSFGLWVHHMYTTGIPALSLAFFAAAGFAVSIPSGLQVFAWIATFAAAPRRIRFDTPTLFILGFLFIFVLGGLTGVMVSVTPFDWQAHDTYFIVAHLHYVLIGGMVFPLLGALYYWAPTLGRPLSERLGKWAFWLLFLGTNVTFFPMHISGLAGMPRRIYTYPAGFGLEVWNAVSSAGAAMAAAGAAVLLLDVAKNFRLGGEQSSPWRAGTLEWVTNTNYGPRSIPRVRDRYPLWSEPGLAKEVEAGGHYLPFTATGRRETLITSPAEAEPQYVAVLPGVGWGHVVAAIGTAGFFLSLTGEFLIEAALFFALALGGILAWLWQGSDPGPLPPREADIGGGIVVPTYATGAVSTASWAMVCLMLVQGTAYACLLGSYLFLWLVNGDAMWPPPGQGLPVAGFGLAALGFYAAGAASLQAAARLLAGRSPWPHRLALALAALLLLAGTAADGWALWQGGVRPSLHAYGAASWALFAWQGMHAAIALLMAGYTLARSLARLLDAERRQAMDVTRLFWIYTAGQGAVGLALLHLFPRLLA
ncbi:cytochrome c oxidase subunit I [Siccirubricoccus deserti]|uniref:Cbb3-type cytochrome c oxidase subunit I n=1 Tax=Siccirubricoccus deserti TaxID=2013562 RepID=A0A9X0R080_9PROT|nr:cbb3-type cytochrome c oxidase subunit I [Siccirubricoccus deserti]MBC4015887.1 cbb3-type cytochrome c oxidase subunit I [Siccirubricoccus deserti]GGC45382.1 cytochrome c oxidase subunit I [Siccirubricoccus deserti]